MRHRMAWAVLGLILVAAGGVRAQAPMPEKMTITLDGKVKMELVLIRPGDFMMGSTKEGNEKPPHKVTITKPFYLGVYEVTQEQWKALMGENPSMFPNQDAPVEQIAWEDCGRFLEKLQAKLDKGMTCRLPTEAEWEYACRAGSQKDYCFGDDPKLLKDYAWYAGDSEWVVHPVGKKKANAWGLYDMHGNVSEWCQDWYDEKYYAGSPSQDPKGPSSGDGRVMRGGSWDLVASYVRSASRAGYDPTHKRLIGFRVVVAKQE